MNYKINKLYVGLVIGIIFPVITSYLIYYCRFSDTMIFSEFIRELIYVSGFTKLVSISVLPNMVFFGIAMKLEKLLAARGIVISTILYAVGVIILRFVL